MLRHAANIAAGGTRNEGTMFSCCHLDSETM